MSPHTVVIRQPPWYLPEAKIETNGWRALHHRKLPTGNPSGLRSCLSGPQPLCSGVGESVESWQEQLTEKQQAELTQWHSDHRCSPNQLRRVQGLAYPTQASRSADVKTGEIAGKEPGVPRSTCIRAHSCPFVVQRHPCVSFASSRLRVRPTARPPPSPQRQSAGSQLQRADLALESTSYLHSCPFVSIRVHSWFNVTPAFPSRLRVFA